MMGIATLNPSYGLPANLHARGLLLDAAGHVVLSVAIPIDGQYKRYIAIGRVRQTHERRFNRWLTRDWNLPPYEKSRYPER
jgi:hypothetical protein